MPGTTKWATRTPWREKLHKPLQPRIVKATGKAARKFGGSRVLISTPLEIEGLLCEVPEGRVTTTRLIREKLTEKHHVDAVCPLTTGIFLRIIAEAAEENARSGNGPVTPYWRVVRDDGRMMEKFPGGPKTQARRLVTDGVACTAIKSGSTAKVRNLADHLYRFV